MQIFYTCPLEIITGAAFLYYLLGNAFLAGLIVMVVALPSTHYINRKLLRIQKQLSEAKSWRIRLVKELIANIKTTKILAWERKWEQIILVRLQWLLLRQREHDLIAALIERSGRRTCKTDKALHAKHDTLLNLVCDTCVCYYDIFRMVHLDREESVKPEAS